MSDKSPRQSSSKKSDKSLKEKLSPHCPEVQGCIRCGVCVETPNPSYRLPEKWKDLGTSPRYLKVQSTPSGGVA